MHWSMFSWQTYNKFYSYNVQGSEDMLSHDIQKHVHSNVHIWFTRDQKDIDSFSSNPWLKHTLKQNKQTNKNRQFLNLTVCKYLTAMNNSEIHKLLPMSCPFIWNPLAGNCGKNDRDWLPETRKFRKPRLALFDNSYGQCAVQHIAL